MAHLTWTPELNTGIREIDVQHRRIVEFINAIHDARVKRDRQAIGAVIEEAVDYTLSHFAFEEALMQDAEYRFAGPHKRVHELFTRKVGELQARFQNGQDITEELHTMLSRWLFNHIRNDDASYVESVRGHMRQNGSDAQVQLKDQIKADLLRELEARSGSRKGWFGRLFGS